MKTFFWIKCINYKNKYNFGSNVYKCNNCQRDNENWKDKIQSQSAQSTYIQFIKYKTVQLCNIEFVYVSGFSNGLEIVIILLYSTTTQNWTLRVNRAQVNCTVKSRWYSDFSNSLHELLKIPRVFFASCIFLSCWAFILRLKSSDNRAFKLFPDASFW